ncbi:chorismate--pyruvate lyase family protein [Thalassolituus oleivorans]|uniref:chorismate--pyruvate lyase family protein n=1 Tax=Thalassolituus oleivorans TaxID=187493 RepID=UPI0030C87B15
MNNFNIKGYVEGGFIQNRRDESVNIAALPPIVRTLLITDGTVTKTLEAYFWEPIRIEQVKQDLMPLDQDIADMNLIAGSSVLLRKVNISGVHSGATYAHAISILNIEHLPQAIRDALISGTIGIGELLRAKGLETYRQITDIYYDNDNRELICRTYLIYINHQPAIQVTEKFPYPLYQQKL